MKIPNINSLNSLSAKMHYNTRFRVEKSLFSNCLFLSWFIIIAQQFPKNAVLNTGDTKEQNTFMFDVVADKNLFCWFNLRFLNIVPLEIFFQYSVKKETILNMPSSRLHSIHEFIQVQRQFSFPSAQFVFISF